MNTIKKITKYLTEEDSSKETLVFVEKEIKRLEEYLLKNSSPGIEVMLKKHLSDWINFKRKLNKKV